MDLRRISSSRGESVMMWGDGRRSSWVVSDAIVGRMVVERWIFAFCNFQLRACKKLTPTSMVTARPSDVLVTSGASLDSVMMSRKRLLIAIGEQWPEERATSYLSPKGHFSAILIKGHLYYSTRTSAIYFTGFLGKTKQSSSPNPLQNLPPALK